MTDENYYQRLEKREILDQVRINQYLPLGIFSGLIAEMITPQNSFSDEITIAAIGSTLIVPVINILRKRNFNYTVKEIPIFATGMVVGQPLFRGIEYLSQVLSK